MKYVCDTSMLSAVELFFKYGIQPGSCTSCILNSDYEGAYSRAHPHIKPEFENIYKTIHEIIPETIRTYPNWKGYEKAEEWLKVDLILRDSKILNKWIAELRASPVQIDL